MGLLGARSLCGGAESWTGAVSAGWRIYSSADVRVLV